MDERFQGLPFGPADILLPQNCDLTRWAVVACDQYTSQPEYWQRVERFVGSAPSALHLILPESSLDGPNVETDIMDVTNTMSRYLREEIFRTCPNALIYVERTLESGKVRKGLVGMVDLEEYDYEAGATTSIRCTEGTILSRIPPRVAVRKNAPVELPHVMLLTDDPKATVIEPLTAAKDRMEKCYDFELMEHSGHLRGWLLDEAEKGRVAQALHALADPGTFHARYSDKLLAFQEGISRLSGAGLYRIVIEDREGCAAVEYTGDSSLAIKELLISPALLDGAVALIKENLQADRYFVRTPALWDGLPGSYIQPFAMVKWLREDLRQAWGVERSGYFGLGFD